MDDQEYINKCLESSSVNFKAANVVYVLQLIGLFTLIAYIFAIILNYIKLSDVRGTWLNSHFRWQIRTFWFGLIWAILGGYWALMVDGYALVGYIIWGLTILWMIYRIERGWIYLLGFQPMYMENQKRLSAAKNFQLKKELSRLP